MTTPHLVRTGPPAGPDGPPGSDLGPHRTGSGEAEWITAAARGGEAAAPAGILRRRGIPSWPLLLLALPASVAVWSGWVGIGQLTGFGEVRPLPGIWNSLHLDTAVTLPVGVEAYAAYALHAWLAASVPLSVRTRRFAKWSAIGSLVLGMAGQVAYHLLTQAGATRAPWGITTVVACLPVLILGMAAGLAHLIRADLFAGRSLHQQQRAQAGAAENPAGLIGPARLAEARVAAGRVIAAGQRVSRRSLRAAGLHGSNIELGALSRLLAADQNHPGRAPDPPVTQMTALRSVGRSKRFAGHVVRHG